MHVYWYSTDIDFRGLKIGLSSSSSLSLLLLVLVLLVNILFDSCPCAGNLKKQMCPLAYSNLHQTSVLYTLYPKGSPLLLDKQLKLQHPKLKNLLPGNITKAKAFYSQYIGMATFDHERREKADKSNVEN